MTPTRNTHTHTHTHTNVHTNVISDEQGGGTVLADQCEKKKWDRLEKTTTKKKQTKTKQKTRQDSQPDFGSAPNLLESTVRETAVDGAAATSHTCS